MKNKIFMYIGLFLALAAVTVFAFYELWPSALRPDSFGYIVFFICYLEGLIILFPVLTQSGVIDESRGRESFLVVLANFITVYIIVSLALLLAGVLLSSFLPTLIYILTLGFTVLFVLMCFVYWNLTVSQDIEDIDDDKGRVEKKFLSTDFENIFIKYQDCLSMVSDDMTPKLNDQFDILRNKFQTMPPSRSVSGMEKADDSISDNINKLSQLFDSIKTDANKEEIENSILNELNILKENLKLRASILKR